MFIALVLFGLGLGTTAAAANWTAFCWVITGLLWFLFYWFSKIEYETTIDEKEEQLKDLRKNRDDYMGLYKHYWDKYDEKLKQNLELAEDNVSLRKELQAAKEDNSREEQKLAQWSEEDERLLNLIIDILDRDEHNGIITHNELKMCVRLLKSLRPQPKQEWSEEDDLMYTAVIQSLDVIGNRGTITMQKNWLKSLRSRYSGQPGNKTDNE